jgi:hypothetical protein
MRRQRGARIGPRWLAIVVLVAGATVPHAWAGQEQAHDIVAHAADLMGGESALRGIRRVTLDMMTQWQRTGFRQVPHTDRPSFEPHFDVRDYGIPAWRNTRDFGARQVRNIIRDSVAVTDFGQGFQPLSVAYVDERDELFTYTPDRLLLALLDATALEAPGDTMIGGERHHRVRGTLGGRYLSTVYFHAGTGLPTLLRFRAGHFADFGLVPWGEMDVEVWYSNWRTFGEISIPTQWDIERVGAPYKRMTVRRADFAPEFAPADSFTITPEQRSEYWASTASRPMHEGVEVPEARIHAGGVAELGGFGLPAGAVDAGDGWFLLGAGQAAFNYDRAVEALAAVGVDRIRGVVIGAGTTGNGGVVRAGQAGLPIYASPAAEPFVRTMLANAGESAGTVAVVRDPLELGTGAHRVLLAPVDLPDSPGSLIVHRPATGWLWVPGASTPLDERLARERARELGWAVTSVGSLNPA